MFQTRQTEQLFRQLLMRMPDERVTIENFEVHDANVRRALKLAAGITRDIFENITPIPIVPASMQGVLFFEDGILPEQGIPSDVELSFVKGPEFPLDPNSFILQYVGTQPVKRSRPILVDFDRDSDVKDFVRHVGLNEAGLRNSDLDLFRRWIKEVALVGSRLFDSREGHVRIDANDGTRIGHAAYFHAHHSRRLLASFDNQSESPTLIGPAIEEQELDRLHAVKSRLLAEISQCEITALLAVERKNFGDFKEAYEKLKTKIETYCESLLDITAADEAGACQTVYSAPQGIMAFSSRPWTAWTQNTSILSAFTHAEPPVRGVPRGMLVIDFE